MKKAIFTLLILLPLAAEAQTLVSILSPAAPTKVEIDSIFYLLQQSGSTRIATVTYEQMDENNKYRSSYSGDIVIPEKVKYKGRSYSVESIGKGAFANCQELTSVTLPMGIESIASIAFGNCKGLKSVNIPSSVKKIRNAAFYGCSSLQKVDFEEAPKDLSPLDFEASAFCGCTALEEVCIRNTSRPVSIPNMMFAECRNLRSFKAMGGVKDIAAKAFQNCTSLSGIDFGSMGTVALDAFDGCTGFSEDDAARWAAYSEIVRKEEQEKRREKMSLDGPPMLSKDFVAEQHTCIDSIYYTIDTKCNYAIIEKCEQSRDSINLPASVNYKEISYPVLEITDGVFKDRKNLAVMVLPDHLQRIGASAFEGCSSLRTICFSDSIFPLTLGERAFYGCSELSSFIIPEAISYFYGGSMPVIAAQAFGECTQLREVNIHDCMGKIEKRAFENCTRLEKVNFTQGLISIDEEAFEGCTMLSDEQKEIMRKKIEANRSIPECAAEFPGDVYAWLNSHIQYPKKCAEKGIQGRASVQFLIEKDGSITNVKALRSPDDLLAKEAERVVRSMPKWKPATQFGRPVRMRYVIPVMFRLS